jgi:hypothetical protein
MGRVILAVIVVYVLSGCHQAVNQYDIQRAEKICGSVENIVEIYATFDAREVVLCFNGERKQLEGG